MTTTGPLTLTGLALKYLEWMTVTGYSPRTVAARREHLERFLAFAEARALVRPIDVTRPIIERYQRHLSAAKKANGRPLSKSRQFQLLVSLSAFFKWLKKQRIIAYDPSAEIELPRLGHPLPKTILSAEEVEQILSAIVPDTLINIRDRAMIETLYSTGLRAGELAALCLEHVDLERGWVVVRNGKGGSDRVVPVGERAVRWVEKYLLDVRPRLVKIDLAGPSLFLSLRGRPFVGNGVSIICRDRIRKAGIEKPGSAHVFRHAAATGMLNGGADIRFIQALLGHRQLSSTQVYTRVAIQKLKEIHDRTHPARLSRRRDPGRSDQ